MTDSEAKILLRAFQDELSKTVMKRRNQKGLSQPDLAKLAGVPLSLIEQIESITGEPSIHELFCILRPLGLTLSIVSV